MSFVELSSSRLLSEVPLYISSSLQRVLEPSILMEMKLSDGNVKTFEVGAQVS